MAAAGGGAAPDMSRFAEAIKAKESGGKYDIVGPTHPKLGRALGAYQVMEANVGPWSREALGREVTPDEFLKNPQIQDQIFQHKFGQYVQKFGNPQDAASAWFTGQPLSVGANRRDVLGTTGAGYVADFNRNIGQQPTQVAQAGMTPDGMPTSPVASDAPPMAYAPGQQAIAQAAPQSAPRGQQLAQAVGALAVPQPQPTGNIQAAMMQILSDPRFSPQQKAQAMQMYQMGQGRPDFDFQVAGDQLFRINKRTGQAEPVQGAVASKPSDVQKQFQQAKSEGFQGTLLDFQKELAAARRPQTNVNVNNSGDDKYDGTLGTGVANLFLEISKEGPNARADIGRVRQLRSLVETLPGGFLGGAQAVASRYGIKLGPNAGNLEAAEAIINQLVPAQRPPGSGTMSDRDVDLFKSSLPSLSNTPQGNKIILDTMEAMAAYKAAQAEIATLASSKQIDRNEALRRINALPDPFEAFKGAVGSQPLAPAPAAARPVAPGEFSDDEIQAEMRRRGLR
jgi:hypothetical protein